MESFGFKMDKVCVESDYKFHRMGMFKRYLLISENLIPQLAKFCWELSSLYHPDVLYSDLPPEKMYKAEYYRDVLYRGIPIKIISSEPDILEVFCSWD